MLLQKETRIGTWNWWTYNVPDKIQLVMVWRAVRRMALGTRMRQLSRRERELERWQRLERERERGLESERVECG